MLLQGGQRGGNGALHFDRNVSQRRLTSFDLVLHARLDQTRYVTGHSLHVGQL